MLVQITNNCTEMCPHCLHDSRPGDFHMTIDTYEKALQFMNVIPSMTLVISGGEPTTHPKFFEFLNIAKKKLDGLPIAIASNGTFLFNDDFTNRLIDFVYQANQYAMVGSVTIQISVFEGLYKDRDAVLANMYKLDKIKNYVILESGKINGIHGLGRAKNNPDLADLIVKKPRTIGCINSVSIFRTDPMTRMVMSSVNYPCKPFVNYKGDVHGGESIFCKSYGNVNTDSFVQIMQNLSNFKPCGGCSEFVDTFVNNKDEKFLKIKRMCNFSETDKK